MRKFYVIVDFLLYILISYLGRAEANADISLKPPLTTAEKYVNDTYIVTCLATGASWQSPRNDKITSSKGRLHVEHLSEGLALVFERIDRKDKGNYTCLANVDGLKKQAYFTLIVRKPISFLNTPKVQSANEYTNTLLRCDVDGDPAPEVTWQIKGKTPEEPKYIKEPKGLLIRNVTLEDAGDYECRAFQMSENPNMEPLTITLKVLHKPMWKSSNSEEKDTAYGYLGGTVNLTCEAVADPEATFTWKRQNKPIKPQHYNATIISEPHRSILQLPIHNMSIYDKYGCEARNNLGRIERLIELKKGEKPEMPAVVSVRGETVNTATLEIQSQEKQENDDIIGYRVQFVKKLPGIEYTWDAPEYQDFDKSNGEYTVKDLLENTTYVIRVASRNAAGLSDYSPEVSVRTRKANEETSGAQRLVTSYIMLITSIYVLFTAH